jgi:hypothetical protein
VALTERSLLCANSHHRRQRRDTSLGVLAVVRWTEPLRLVSQRAVFR